jgi:hypothetical protein
MRRDFDLGDILCSILVFGLIVFEVMVIFLLACALLYYLIHNIPPP